MICEAQRSISVAQPIFDAKIFDLQKFALVVGHGALYHRLIRDFDFRIVRSAGKPLGLSPLKTAAGDLGDLSSPPGNRLEALAGDRKRQHSIRINDQFRVCFVWTAEGPAEVEIVDYH